MTVFFRLKQPHSAMSLVISKTKFSIFLIILSVAINEKFVSYFILGMVPDGLVLWVLRAIVISIVLLLNLRSLGGKKSVTWLTKVLFLLTMTVSFGFILSAADLIYYPQFICTWAYYIFLFWVIYILIGRSTEDDFARFVLLVFFFFGLVYSFGWINLNPEEVSDPNGIYLNIINFPIYGFVALLALTSRKIILFHAVFLYTIVMSFLAHERTLLISTLIFYIVRQGLGCNFSSKLFRVFAFTFLLIATGIVGVLESEVITTETLSTGRGEIWGALWRYYLNSGIGQLLFGNPTNYLSDFGSSIERFTGQSEVVNLSLNYSQAHSIALKTLMDFGLLGFIIILVLLVGGNACREVKDGAVARAVFYSALTISGLNSSTNIIRFDMVGLLLIFSLAYLHSGSNQPLKNRP